MGENLDTSRVQAVGAGMLRYGLIAILVLFGAMKWSGVEAEGIRPWVENSPFMSWMYDVMSVQAASNLIGVVEITIAGLILAGRWAPKVAAVGAAMAIGMFLITLSFLVTTPNQSPEGQGFLMKDFFLLATAVWLLGGALTAGERGTSAT